MEKMLQDLWVNVRIQWSGNNQLHSSQLHPAPTPIENRNPIFHSAATTLFSKLRSDPGG